MAKDYAKYNAKQRARKQSNRGWILLVLICMVLIVGVFAWIYSNKNRISPIMTNISILIHHKKSVVAVAKPVVHENAPAPVHFAFYNDLPNMKMNPGSLNEPTTKSETKPKGIVKEPAGFVIKLGEYHDENAASQMRISLLLLGVDSTIVKVGEMYQLQQGAYSTLALAKAAQKKLQKKGIEATVEKAGL